MPVLTIIPSVGTGEWRRTAVGVLGVVGGLASLGGVVGRVGSVVTESLAYIGTAAVVVAVGTIVGPWVRRSIASSDPARGPSESQAMDRVDKETTPLELYQAEGCPYCRKVRKFCTRAGISVVLHNPRTAGSMVTPGRVTNGMAHEDLTGYGKDQIPLLVDTERGESIYESTDIIEYLRAHYA